MICIICDLIKIILMPLRMLRTRCLAVPLLRHIQPFHLACLDQLLFAEVGTAYTASGATTCQHLSTFNLCRLAY